MNEDIAAFWDAIHAIHDERQFQDQKFGPGSQHTIGEWILIMESELAEAKVAIIKGGEGRNSVLMEIVQVAAVAVACLEQHGVKEVGRMQPIRRNGLVDSDYCPVRCGGCDFKCPHNPANRP